MSDEDPPPPSKRPDKKAWHRRPLLVGLIVFGGIALIVACVLIWRHSRKFETTDDAYVDVVSEQASAQVGGRVLHVRVDDNQDVTKGQVLVELDPADYQIKREQAEAATEQARAQLIEAKAQQSVFAAQAAQAKASLGTAEANAENAKDQFNRYSALRKQNAVAVSGQQWDSAVAANRAAAAQLEAAQKAVEAAEAQTEYAASLLKVAQAGIVSAEAQVREADLNLSYTHVQAQIDGRIASKTVSEGNWVTAGTPLMAVVPRQVYITANFKETQLARMRKGQPVTVKVDSYPDLKLTGRIDGVQPATGQAFSLLPAQNATGNWVKIIQRVPVKIVLDALPDDSERRLGPGMSAEISVRIR